MPPKATDDQIRDWARKLYVILGEAELAYGDPAPGCTEERIVYLVREAWAAVQSEATHRITAR